MSYILYFVMLKISEYPKQNLHCTHTRLQFSIAFATIPQIKTCVPAGLDGVPVIVIANRKVFLSVSIAY